MSTKTTEQKTSSLNLLSTLRGHRPPLVILCFGGCPASVAALLCSMFCSVLCSVLSSGLCSVLSSGLAFFVDVIEDCASQISRMRAWCKSIFQNARVAFNFKQNLQTVTRIVMWDFHNPGDCLQVLFEIEHRARVLESKFAPRSHSGGLGSAILDDVDEK